MENETLNIPKVRDGQKNREFNPKEVRNEYNENIRTQLRDMNVQIFQNHEYTTHSSSKFEFLCVCECADGLYMSELTQSVIILLTFLKIKSKSIALVKCQ